VTGVSGGDQISESQEQPSSWRNCVFNMKVNPFVKQMLTELFVMTEDEVCWRRRFSLVPYCCLLGVFSQDSVQEKKPFMKLSH